AFVAYRMLRTLRARALLPGLAIGILAVAINLGHWSRNYVAFDSPIALAHDRGGFSLANDTHIPQAVASNVVRNISLHVGLPWATANVVTKQAVESLHEMIGISVTDPRTTYLPGAGFVVTNRWNIDDGASAPLHLVLVLGLFLALLSGRFRA